MGLNNREFSPDNTVGPKKADISLYQREAILRGQT